jgi:CheY-like chemotaxis protein
MDAAGRPVVVMVSSMGDPLTERAAAEAGIDVFLVKPVRHGALLESLRRALGRVAEAPEDIRPAGESAVPADLHAVRVLLAEDNEINTLLARTILEHAGFRVRCVANGRDALEAVRHEPFDLILMDVQMPVMDGLEATRRIRALGGAFAELPIVAMTANAMATDRAACLDAGMDDFIAKPIDVAAFLGVLERMSGDEPGRNNAEAAAV